MMLAPHQAEIGVHTDSGPPCEHSDTVRSLSVALGAPVEQITQLRESSATVFKVGNSCVRLCPAWVTATSSKASLRISTLLAARGVRTPRALNTEPVPVRLNGGIRFAELYEFIEFGDDARESPYEQGAHLAEIHQASWTDITRGQNRHLYDTLPMLRRGDPWGLTADGWASHLPYEFMRAAYDARTYYETACANIGSDICVLHGDLWYENLRRDAEGNWWSFDVEYSGLGNPAWDVAYAAGDRRIFEGGYGVTDFLEGYRDGGGPADTRSWEAMRLLRHAIGALDAVVAWQRGGNITQRCAHRLQTWRDEDTQWTGLTAARGAHGTLAALEHSGRWGFG